MSRRDVGDEAEEASAKLLERDGYRLRARNWTCQYGEVDLVAEKDGVLCFVEVRMRSTDLWGDPSGTVHGKKQRRVVKAALRYLFENELEDQMVRFDVISV